MKWIENGVTFEGTVAEYKELHADGFAPQLQRTHAGRSVTVDDAETGSATTFPTVKAAAEYISMKTGRLVSSSALGRLIGGDGRVSIDQFKNGAAAASLFSAGNSTEGENTNAQ